MNVANLDKRRMMKHSGRYISFLTACVCLVFLGGARAQAACSNSSAKGTYAFTCNGTSDGVSVAIVGQLILDGKGKASGSFTAMVGGNLAYGPFGRVKGTYTVNKDCTGSTEFTSPSPTSHYDISLFNGGFFSLETDSGAEVTCPKLVAKSD
jgi:hypothetical protein